MKGVVLTGCFGDQYFPSTIQYFHRGWEVSIKLLLIKLAGDTKIGKVVHNDEVVRHTSCKLVNSALLNKIRYNTGKSKVMVVGTGDVGMYTRGEGQRH